MATNKQLDRYAQPQIISPTQDDSRSPLSFQAWYESRRGIIANQEYKQYNDYLLQWYKDKNAQTTDFKAQLRIKYLQLLRQIQLFFTKEEANNWYNNIDLNNDKEVLLAIPYFAEKLKDISLYYLRLRDNVKQSKLLYNQTGTDSGILLQLQKFFLSNYTQKPDTTISVPIAPTTWKNVPQLSSIRDTLTIEFQELYDSHNYFDQSVNVPVSAYYDVSNEDLQEFLTSKNLPLTSANWIYRLGTFPVEKFPGTDSTPPDEFLDLNLIDGFNELTKKYLGQDLYTALAPVLSAQYDLYNVPVEFGNNFFYWPYGPYVNTDFNPVRYKNIALSSLGLETFATAGTSIELADTIFVKTAKGMQGAWLYNIPYSRQELKMQAIVPASKKYKFKFPFPNFGLSGEDITWTGPGLSSDNRFFFLEEKYKDAVDKTYWSTGYGLTSINPVPINDTTLIDNRAYANKSYNLADKIRYWAAAPAFDEPSYVGDVKEAWLYRMDTTDISIGVGDNVVYWPFEKIYSDFEFPTYFPTNIDGFCTPVSISGVKLPFATASDVLSGKADRIYKIRNYQDSVSDAIECCWLSGQSSLHPKYSTYTTEQPGLNLLLQPGEFTRFVWNGGDNISVDRVFTNFKHQPDCPFSYDPDITYKDHTQCDCRMVQFTPFGHPGAKYMDNPFLADFIVEDTFLTNPVNLDTSFFTSPSSGFCWYQTSSKTGWGDGKWLSNYNNLYNRFYLKKGKAYIYYRANDRTNSSQAELPGMAVRAPYPNYETNYNNSFAWMRAIQDEDGNWVQTDQPSQMELYPGDLFVYSKTPTSTHSVSGDLLVTQNISENRGSIWSNYDYVSINNNLIPITVAPPTNFYPDISTLNATDPYQQYINLQPPTLREVKAWSITNPLGEVSLITDGTPVVSFFPSLTGLYTFALTALTATVITDIIETPLNPLISSYYSSTQTIRTSTVLGYAYINSIPPITAVSDQIIVQGLTAIETPTTGFVMNVPLEGWDYNRSTASTYTAATNKGARPFWAATGVEKNAYTNYKGIESWGSTLRLIDNYNIITQPFFSDIVFDIGNYIEYSRNYPVEMSWEQPVTIFYPINQNVWSTIYFDTTAESNFANILKNTRTQLITRATTDPSPITLTNVVNDSPVEVYYNALNAFTWPITAEYQIQVTAYSEPSVALGYQANRPWNNLLNQFNPTVAAFPAFESLQTTTEVGGFFTPQNLGISVYTGKDYTVEFNLSSTAYTGYFEDVKKRVGGRSLSKTDNNTPYNISDEDNIWLKEPILTGPIAGSNNKNVFKKYQKFIPYQSVYETNPRSKVGLVTPNSLQTPWTGKEDSEWGDLTNQPKTFTGERDISKWADSQILKQNELEIDNWVTDIFGNQYGLYKQLDGVLPHNRKNVLGEIWVRKNTQFVAPAKIALEKVFDTYSSLLSSTLYNQLTGQGIKKIDMFFDTLYVETTGLVLFEKINYDYDNDNIFSLADEARYISLPLPVTTNINRELSSIPYTPPGFAKVGETWFFPNEKRVIISLCGLQDNIVTPELYSLDTNNQLLTKLFPTKPEDITTLNSLSGLEITEITSPLLTYSAFKKEYVMAFEANSKIVELTIRDLPVLELTNVTVYEQTTAALPPYITQNLTIYVNTGNSFSYQVNAIPITATFTPTNKPSWVNLTSTGLFTGTAPSTAGTHNAEFYIENSVGITYYTLSIIVQ